MNNNIGCFGWGIIIFVVLLGIAYWQIFLPFAFIAGICWYFYERSPKVQEKKAALKRQQEKAQQQQEEHRRELVSHWQNMDLAEAASKVTDVKLAKTEYCYFHTSYLISWKEQRNKSVRVNYGGLTGRVHIAKGLNYRLGSIKAETQHETYFKELLQGVLLLTDRRIIVVSSDDAKAYRFTKILRVIPYSDATILVNESGKQTILSGFRGNDGEQFNIFLDRLMTK